MDIATRGVFSHTQQLPYELLVEIFLHYDNAAAYSFPTPKLPPPLLLGQICSTWRHVVHGAPELWTRFSLDVEKGVEEEEKVEHVSFAKVWLSRAHPYPLYVSLRVWRPIEALSRIMDSILPSADRLRNIQLRLPFPFFQPLVDVGSMPFLESVYLSTDFDYGPDPALWVRRITAFTTAPRLSSVTLSCFSKGLFGSGMQFPWSQLTKLYIDESCIAPDTCREAFLQCTNLIDCTLNVDAWEEAVIPDVPIVTFPHLRKLNVTFTGGGQSYPFFQPLNLPTLKDLTLSMGRSNFPHEIFMEFVLRSLLDLERLSFHVVEIDTHELLQFLLHMQSLVELEIKFSWCDDDLFDALCYREMDSQHLVPKLEKLFIEDAFGKDIDDSGVANMIESRWWTDDAPRMVSRLKEVYVYYDDDVEIDARVRERLERCCREGLILSLD